MLRGRKEIFTDEQEITRDNIILVLQKAMPYFTTIASDCHFLLNYEAGEQPILREKTYRPDIDCHCEDNIANEITEFKLGFNWGNPITLVQRGEKDSGVEDEALAISMLNECYEAEKIKSKTQALARYIEICGIGYTLIDINTDWEEGDSYFTVDVLDPRFAFVVKSSMVGHKPMLGVSFRKDEIGNVHFTCFTKTRRFEILNLVKIVNGEPVSETDEERAWDDEKRWTQKDRSGELNPLGRIPVIEWIRSHDRMGCFERQISEMDNLNLLISDFSNDVDQNTQAIWHGNDIDFPVDEEGNVVRPKTNDWILTHTTTDGKQPFINPLSVSYDYAGMLSNIVTRRALILQKCNVPQRNDDSGGSTGIAMSDATGWSAAESAACKEQNIIEGCKMDEVKVVLSAIKKSSNVPTDSPLLKLKYSDIQPNIKRQKTYEMVTKSSCFANLVSHGIDGLHALKAINLFDDVNQVYEDSKDLIKSYQDSMFNNAKDTTTQDENQTTDGGYEAQIENSPMIDGQSKEKPVVVDDKNEQGMTNDK